MKSKIEKIDKSESEANQVTTEQRGAAYNRAVMLYAQVMNDRNLGLKEREDMLYQAEASIEKALLFDKNNANYRSLQERIWAELRKMGHDCN